MSCNIRRAAAGTEVHLNGYSGGGMGGEGGDGGMDIYFNQAPGGDGGDTFDGPWGVYAELPNVVQLGGFGNAIDTAGFGGPPGTGTPMGVVGSVGTSVTCPVERIDIRAYQSNDEINWNEYIANTRPRDGRDWFHIREVRRTNACAIFFVGSTQRLYSLYACTNIAADAWQTVSGCVGFWGIGTNTTFEDTNAARHMSYRVGVALP